MFAEIILPLPLYGTFTYAVGEDIAGRIQSGSRVLVQFGKKKYYTGIVERVHNEAPSYEVKPIMALLDERPIVRYPQLKFWNWISEYYLCSPGEVFKAAVPTGLKPESETFVTLNEDYEPQPGFKLTERMAMVVMLLEERKRMRISEIETETKFKNCGQLMAAMLEHGLVEIDEKVVERYKPKTECFIELCAERGDHDKIHEFFDLTRRSRNQEKALIYYLDRSGWMQTGAKLREVKRKNFADENVASPAVVKAMIDKGIFRVERRSVNRFNNQEEKGDINLAKLSEAQDEALHRLLDSFKERNVALLHGVTGSGKTEIYTHLISRALHDGNQVLYLVPEISLTTQLTDRLRLVFGQRLIVYHSKFSDNERVDIWRRLLSSHEPLVVLGVRSSVFLPFHRLGLVVIDEEHESSYKQYDPAPRYNARDAAIMLATMHGAKVLLGSATPSIETYYKALHGKYGLVSLKERFRGAVLPDVEIVSMPEQRKKKIARGTLSQPLREAMAETIRDKKQTILFQNRRGFAPVVVCQQCGWVPKCDNCDVSMVYHKNAALLRCHYCGFTRQLPSVCPACGSNAIGTFGYGTERIAEEIKEQFPDAGIRRLDLDTTRNKDAYQEIIEGFASHDTDILVGTQMVSKGLDFEGVETVGVINADTLLNFPDFRSNERAFNMLEQVAGRAGRRERKGRVIIQTSRADDPVLAKVREHDYTGFYEMEIVEREKYGYPPFTKVINIFVRNKDSRLADAAAVTFALALRNTFGARVLGPEKPFVSRVNLWYVQQIMLKVESGASMKKVKNLLRAIYESLAARPEMKATQIQYDVDPA